MICPCAACAMVMGGPCTGLWLASSGRSARFRDVGSLEQLADLLGEAPPGLLAAPHQTPPRARRPPSPPDEAREGPPAAPAGPSGEDSPQPRSAHARKETDR